MPEPIVSFDTIQRRAGEAATAAQCPQLACPWPLESAAGQAFLLEFRCQQARQHDRDAMAVSTGRLRSQSEFA